MSSEFLLDKTGTHYIRLCPAKVNDYVECFEETDVLFALSICLREELSKWVWAMNEGGHPTLGMILRFWKNGSYLGLLGTNGSMGHVCLIL